MLRDGWMKADVLLLSLQGLNANNRCLRAGGLSRYPRRLPVHPSQNIDQCHISVYPLFPSLSLASQYIYIYTLFFFFGMFVLRVSGPVVEYKQSHTVNHLIQLSLFTVQLLIIWH